MSTTLVTLEIRMHEFGKSKAPPRFAKKHAMHAHNCKTVRKVWGEEHSVPAHVLAFSPVSNMAYFIQANWVNLTEKNAAFMAFSQTLKEYECSHYTFVCETRIKSQKLDGPIEIEHEDAITVVTSDAEGRTLCSSFVKDENGRVQAMPELETHGDVESQGLVGCFLRPGDLMENYASVCIYESEHQVRTTD